MRTSDKAQRGASQAAQVINQDRLQGSAYRTGVFEAGCQQWQGSSAFPDDWFCREERNRELEAGTCSCSRALSLICLHSPH